MAAMPRLYSALEEFGTMLSACWNEAMASSLAPVSMSARPRLNCNVAVNALWPRTTVATAAIQNLLVSPTGTTNGSGFGAFVKTSTGFAKGGAKASLKMLVPMIGCIFPTLWVILLGPAALLVARMFMLQHDCGHGAFFKSQRANDALGFITGVLTFSPYYQWRYEHAIHHATSGNLDRRGFGDTRYKAEPYSNVRDLDAVLEALDIERAVLVEDPYRTPQLVELARGCRDPGELAQRVRALGATQRDILLQFLSEALLISIAGGVAGILSTP